MDPHKKLTILWRMELAAIQEKYGMPKYRERSRAFVIGKILEKVPLERLSRDVSRLLFERDYTKADEEIREYRRGEIAKALDAETDPEKQIGLMMKQSEAKINLKMKTRRRRRR